MCRVDRCCFERLNSTIALADVDSKLTELLVGLLGRCQFGFEVLDAGKLIFKLLDACVGCFKFLEASVRCVEIFL